MNWILTVTFVNLLEINQKGVSSSNLSSGT